MPPRVMASRVKGSGRREQDRGAQPAGRFSEQDRERIEVGHAQQTEVISSFSSLIAEEK